MVLLTGTTSSLDWSDKINVISNEQFQSSTKYQWICSTILKFNKTDQFLLDLNPSTILFAASLSMSLLVFQIIFKHHLPVLLLWTKTIKINLKEIPCTADFWYHRLYFSAPMHLYFWVSRGTTWVLFFWKVFVRQFRLRVRYLFGLDPPTVIVLPFQIFIGWGT